jgi:hypothetical protein
MDSPAPYEQLRFYERSSLPGWLWAVMVLVLLLPALVVVGFLIQTKMTAPASVPGGGAGGAVGAAGFLGLPTIVWGLLAVVALVDFAFVALIASVRVTVAVTDRALYVRALFVRATPIGVTRRVALEEIESVEPLEVPAGSGVVYRLGRGWIIAPGTHTIVDVTKRDGGTVLISTRQPDELLAALGVAPLDTR